jgi:hypothetical protein
MALFSLNEHKLVNETVFRTPYLNWSCSQVDTFLCQERTPLFQRSRVTVEGLWTKLPGKDSLVKTISKLFHYTRCSYEVPRIILLQAYLHAYSLPAGVTFEVLPLSSYAISPTMLPLVETFFSNSWTIGFLGFDFRQGLGIFIFTTASKTALGPTQPPMQWVPGALSLGIKRPGREADHSTPSSAEVKECVELYLHSPNTPSWSDL